MAIFLIMKQLPSKQSSQSRELGIALWEFSMISLLFLSGFTFALQSIPQFTQGIVSDLKAHSHNGSTLAQLFVPAFEGGILHATLNTSKFCDIAEKLRDVQDSDIESIEDDAQGTKDGGATVVDYAYSGYLALVTTASHQQTDPLPGQNKPISPSCSFRHEIVAVSAAPVGCQYSNDQSGLDGEMIDWITASCENELIGAENCLNPKTSLSLVSFTVIGDNVTCQLQPVVPNGWSPSTISASVK